MRRRKITPEQRHELLQVYLHLGPEISAELCLEYGVCAKYAAAEAATLGLGRPIWRAGNRYKDNLVNAPLPKSHADPRWQRAIDVGPVTA